MAKHRRRSAAAVLCIVAACLVAGCDGDEPLEGSPAAPPSATGQDERAANGGDESMSATDPDKARCVRAERNAADWPWTWRAVDDVAESATGHSDRARRAVERYVASTRERLHERCGGTPPRAFREFTLDIRRILLHESFGDRQLYRVLAAWSRWGAAVGEPGAARRTVREVRACRELFTRFDATYRTWWRWTSTGKAWWIDITFENRTGDLLAGSTWARVKVTEMVAEPTRVVDAMLQSGASSRDSFNAPPGRTVWRVPLGDPDIRTTAAGTFRVIEVAYYLWSDDMSYDCKAPAHPVL